METRSGSQILASGIALTGTAAASTSTAKIASADQQTLYVKYTPGASSNVLTVTLETSPSGNEVTDANADWYQDMEWLDAAGVLTKQAKSLQHTAANTSAVFLVFDLPRQGNRLRIKYSEVGTTKGTISAILFSRPTSA